MPSQPSPCRAARVGAAADRDVVPGEAARFAGAQPPQHDQRLVGADAARSGVDPTSRDPVRPGRAPRAAAAWMSPSVPYPPRKQTWSPKTT